jgi:hypothetical protein
MVVCRCIVSPENNAVITNTTNTYLLTQQTPIQAIALSTYSLKQIYSSDILYDIVNDASDLTLLTESAL